MFRTSLLAGALAAASTSRTLALPGDDLAALGASAAYAEQPTVTYAPLQGADFVAPS